PCPKACGPRYMVRSGSNGGSRGGGGSCALIRLAQGFQPGTWSQIALTAAISGIARNSPGMPQTSSQNRHASMTVVALRSRLRPRTDGTILWPSTAAREVKKTAAAGATGGETWTNESSMGGMPAMIGPRYGM